MVIRICDICGKEVEDDFYSGKMFKHLPEAKGRAVAYLVHVCSSCMFDIGRRQFLVLMKTKEVFENSKEEACEG